MLARRQLDALAVKVGEAFLGDWQVVGRTLGGRDPAAVRATGAGGDVMLPAARQRVRRAQAALGWGSGSMEARAVSGVLLEDRPCGEVAGLHGWGAPAVAMAALRDGLARLAAVYDGLGEGMAA